jgi:hypothetical protein
MDKIQIYAICANVGAIIVLYLKDDGIEDRVKSLISVCFWLPVMGRVFNWW